MVHGYGTVGPESRDQHCQTGKKLLVAETEDELFDDWDPEISFVGTYLNGENGFGGFVSETIEGICIFRIGNGKD